MDSRYELQISEYGGLVKFQIPLRVAQELKAGRLLVNFTAGPETQSTSWVQFLNPGRNPAVSYDLIDADHSINTSRSFEGLETDPGHLPSEDDSSVDWKEDHRAPVELTNEQFEEIERGRNYGNAEFPVPKWSKKRTETSRDRKASFENIPARPVAFEPLSYDEARKLVEERNLLRHRKQGVINFHPSDSLVKADFSRKSDIDFVARAVFVASNIGSDKAVARISTNHELRIPGVTTLSEWWSKASLSQQAVLLSSAKKFDRRAQDISRLAKLRCPFREAGFGEN